MLGRVAPTHKKVRRRDAGAASIAPRGPAPRAVRQRDAVANEGARRIASDGPRPRAAREGKRAMAPTFTRPPATGKSQT